MLDIVLDSTLSCDFSAAKMLGDICSIEDTGDIELIRDALLI